MARIARSLRRLPWLLLALLAWPALTQQQPAAYTVEIVVFRTAGASPTNDASAPGAADAGISSRPASGQRLGDVAGRLRASGAYRVVGQAAWTQAPAPWNSRRGVSAAQVGLGGGLAGTVILERGQFLHLGFDLRYTEGDRSWHLNEVRRVRPNERQYFDHPALGVIAVVTPAAE